MSVRNSFIIVALIACTVYGGAHFFGERKRADEVSCNDGILRQNLIHWEEDVRSRGLDPSGSLGRLRSLTVVDTKDFAGLCDLGNRRIQISKRQMNRGYWSTRAAVYHELGHLVFNLKHGDCGIMNSNTYEEEYYRENWDLLLEEYLDKCYERRFESL
jgi:hypothetical protein